MFYNYNVYKFFDRINLMVFNFFRTDFNGDPNIGLYGFATDDYCLLGTKPQNKALTGLKRALAVEVKISTVSGTGLIGLFAAGNSNGMVITKIIEDYELERLRDMFDINIQVIKSKETAIGNLILCNDSGCLISGSLKRFKNVIQDTLDCEVDIGKISKFHIVGSAGKANNFGCLCHREASETEMKKIEDLLDVKVDVGTVSYGSPLVKAGIIVNGNGVVFSGSTTGAELGRIEEVFV
jgi:translation initiation factor 6